MSSAQNERGDALDLANLVPTELFDDEQQDALHELASRIGATEMSEPVGPHARSEPPAQLCFRLFAARRPLLHVTSELRVAAQRARRRHARARCIRNQRHPQGATITARR